MPCARRSGATAGRSPRCAADDLAAVPIAALLERNPSLEPAAIDEVLLGCANQAGEDNRNVARMAALLAGLPVSVPRRDRQPPVRLGPGRGGDGRAHHPRRRGARWWWPAASSRCRARRSSCRRRTPPSAATRKIYDTTIGWRFVNPRLQASSYGIDSMPETGENVAAQFNIARADQDRFALRSQQRTAAAQARGFFERELVPVEIPQRKGKPLQREPR